MDDLHALPKFRDGLSYLYLEHGRVDQDQKSISVHDAQGKVLVPVATLCVLMLGPGTRITHAAIRTLAENNCLVIWCGEENVRFYAWGIGGTRSAAPLLRQAALASNEDTRRDVAVRMYRMRFDEVVEEGATIEKLRGMEGARVRRAYARLSEETGVPWTGRFYGRDDWNAADPANRALSAANSCLYGLCHAAILSCGYSPAIGFIHTGKQLSFVYDIADLYKTEITVPVAFRTAAEGAEDLERAVRLRMRDTFADTKRLKRIVPDIRAALGDGADEDADAWMDEDPARPAPLWTPSNELGAT